MFSWWDVVGMAGYLFLIHLIASRFATGPARPAEWLEDER